MLAKLVKETYQVPAMIREITAGRMELEEKLNLSGSEDKEKIQNNLAHTDRELEWLRSRQAAAVATINLLAALIGAGQAEDARAVLAALEGKTEPDREKGKDQEELQSGTFLIKETKPGKKEGTIWAVATAADGSEMFICAKNGDGKALTEAEGKQVKVRYRGLGKDKIFAVKVEIAG